MTETWTEIGNCWRRRRSQEEDAWVGRGEKEIGIPLYEIHAHEQNPHSDATFLEREIVNPNELEVNYET